MSEYVAKVLLSVNGQEITDFKSFTEPTIVPNRVIEAANKTGFAGATKRYADIKVEYLIPKNDPEFDWESVSNGNLTIDFENGVRVTFTGVYTLEIGGAKLGDEGDPIREITLGAVERITE